MLIIYSAIPYFHIPYFSVPYYFIAYDIVPYHATRTLNVYVAFLGPQEAKLNHRWPPCGEGESCEAWVAVLMLVRLVASGLEDEDFAAGGYYIYTHIYVDMYMYIYICMYVCTYVCTCKCRDMFLHSYS